MPVPIGANGKRHPSYIRTEKKGFILSLKPIKSMRNLVRNYP